MQVESTTNGLHLLHAETGSTIGEVGLWLGVQVGKSVEVVDVNGCHVDGAALFREEH